MLLQSNQTSPQTNEGRTTRIAYTHNCIQHIRERPPAPKCDLRVEDTVCIRQATGPPHVAQMEPPDEGGWGFNFGTKSYGSGIETYHLLERPGETRGGHAARHTREFGIRKDQVA